jgi:hypothetical protein
LGATSTISVVVSFFVLGGDSLKAGQLISAMRKKFNVGLSVADLFTTPSIEGIAKKILSLKSIESSNQINSSHDSHILLHQKDLLKQDETIYQKNLRENKSLKIANFSENSEFIRKAKAPLLQDLEDGMNNYSDKYTSTDHVLPYSSLSIACLLVQALPLMIVYPIRRLVIWFLIAWLWVEMMNVC